MLTSVSTVPGPDQSVTYRPTIPLVERMFMKMSFEPRWLASTGS